MQDVAARTDGKMRLSPGTLYSSIKRMIEQGLVIESDERPDRCSTTSAGGITGSPNSGCRVAVLETERLSRLVSQAVANLLPKSI